MRFARILLLSCYMTTPYTGALAQYTPGPDCLDSEYADAHPAECGKKSYFTATTISMMSGATLLGGALAWLGISAWGNETDNADPTQTFQPTLPTYNMVGGDVESIHLATATTTPEYEKNANQYDDIRLGYSIARGFTGRGSTIAILDSGDDTWHGYAVATIASGPISPNATVQQYKIANSPTDFLPYSDIGDVIQSASDADIFNASWSVPMRATELVSRQQLIRLTNEHFVSQLIQSANRGAIFVWAAGNDASAQSSLLSAMPAVIPELQGHFVNVVAWDTSKNTLADYSNACGITKQWCITAPGTGISVGHQHATGTSFATPIVSSAIAVIKEAFPYMSAPEITSLLFETARDLGAPGVDDIYGHGMLDLERATRPVGVPLVPIDGAPAQELHAVRMPGTIARNVIDTNPQFAYFDKYGRAFNANISDIISIKNPGIGFQRLRATPEINVLKLGALEFGLMTSDIVLGDGFMQTRGNDMFNFVGTKNSITFGDITLTQRTRIAFGTPQTTTNSVITNFSNIYMTSIGLDAQYQDWTFGISIPDTIIDGTMTMRLPTGKTATGTIIYRDYSIDLMSRPAIEYSASYKSITASFVDYPYGTDEFFIMVKGNIKF